MPETWERIDSLIGQDRSPEQISGWLKTEKKASVSHEWIYQHIYDDKAQGGTLAASALPEKEAQTL